MAKQDDTSLLEHLRQAVAKVRLLLPLLRAPDRQGILDIQPSNISEYFDATASPCFSSPSSSPLQRRLSQTNCSPKAGVVLTRTISGLSGVSIVLSRTPTPGGPMFELERVALSPGDLDVDRKAEEFIRAFRERLDIERKVSLEPPHAWKYRN